MRWMIARANEQGVGIDVGWCVGDEVGNLHEFWWGNTRDADSLRLLVADAERRLPAFGLDDSLRRALGLDAREEAG